MQPKRSLPLVLALALATIPAAAALDADFADASGDAARACSVPCGYIYPLILIKIADQQDRYALAKGGVLELPATLTYRFDVMNEGFTIPSPSEPIIVTFEFPRKPEWAGMEVEPSQIEIPIQPQYIQPNADDPNNVQAYYVYTTDVTLRVSLDGQAVLPDGYDYAKLLAFAKSTESGLYKAGYGIKEIKVEPEGAVHESDLAPDEPLEIVDLAPATLAPHTQIAPGVEVTLTPPGPQVEAWQPARFTMHVESPDGSALPALVSATLLDEAGAVAYASGPRAAPGGELGLNLTLPGPGRLTLAAFVEPADPAERTFVPQVFAFPVDVGAVEGDAVRFPKEYKAQYSEVVGDARGNADEPLYQFEKAIPFPVAPGSSGAAVTVALKSTAFASVPADSPTGLGNLNLQVIDPEGAVIMQGTVDAANPLRAYPVGALPGSGWFVLRVSGVGVPQETAYDVRISVTYDDRPVLRRTTDGVIDALVAPVKLDRVNATLNVADAQPFLAPWSPATLSAALERDGAPHDAAVRYAFTAVAAADGNAAYASGARLATGALGAQFTPPAPGRYVAYAYVEPAAPGPGFEPFIIQAPFVVGDPAAQTVPAPATFDIADEGVLAGPIGRDAPVAEYRIPPGAADAVDADVTGSFAGGSYSASVVESGDHRFLRVIATSALPEDAFSVAASTALSGVGAIGNPNFQAAPATDGGQRIPAPGLALVGIALLGATALATRRRD